MIPEGKWEVKVQIDGSFWPLACKCFHQEFWKVEPCQEPYICVQITDSLQHQCAANGMRWRRMSGGKCRAVWAAMMVVPNCRCSLPTFLPSVPLVPSIPPFSSHLFLLGLSNSPSGRPDLSGPPLITHKWACPWVCVCVSEHARVCVCLCVSVAHLQGCIFFLK